MIGELQRLGYAIKPGAIYLLLDSLQKKDYLSVEMKREWRRTLSEYPAMWEGKKDITSENLFSGSFGLDWPNGVRYRLIDV